MSSLPYARLCEYYDRLDATTKRLELTDILVELLQEAPVEDLDHVVNLTQGKLAPDFVGVEVGLADKLVLRALAFATGFTDDKVKAMYRETGDLGDVAEGVMKRATGGGKRGTKAARQTTLFGGAGGDEGGEPLTIASVFDAFDEIARASGSGSQERKLNGLQRLLVAATPREAKYAVRTITGKLRLGIADMTLLDALALAFASKEYRPDLERAYNVSSDLGRVARTLAEGGLDAVEEIHLTVGVPVRAMLAERLPSADAILDKLGGKALVEYKYDGLRLQGHVTADGDVHFYSRRLEDLTSQFPDVAESLRAAFKGRSVIVEGEAVAVDPDSGEMRPFQEISTRRGRKHGLEEAIKAVPVNLYLFDCLLLDDEDITLRPLPERRAAFMKAFRETTRIKYSRAETVTETEDLLRFFDEAVGDQGEGVMAKSVAEDSHYRAGSRGWQWIKFKRDYEAALTDSLDLVVVGALAGRGRRKGWYGALLMAAYNPEEDVFETVCKLGTGFDDETLKAMPRMFAEEVHEGGPHPRVRSEMDADYWFTPTRVMEVIGAELTLSPIHTAGYGAIREGAGVAVRFPRFTGNWREDKAPEDATSSQEVVEMYRSRAG